MWGGGDEEEGRTARSKEFPITTETDPLLVRSKGLEYCGGLLGNNSTYEKKKERACLGCQWEIWHLQEKLQIWDFSLLGKTSNFYFSREKSVGEGSMLCWASSVVVESDPIFNILLFWGFGANPKKLHCVLHALSLENNEVDPGLLHPSMGTDQNTRADLHFLVF